MLPVFIALFAAGAVLIGASLIFGGDSGDADADADVDADVEVDADVDADVDVDVDVDADTDVEAEAHAGFAGSTAEALHGAGQAWIPFLSMRFWTFAAAAFGLTGILLSIAGLGDLVASLVASPVGLASGLGAAYLFRYLKKSEVSADVGLRRLVGSEARVLLTVRAGGRGKIVFEGPSGRVELPAVTRDDKPLAIGSTVLIAHVDDDGTAQVTGLGVAPTAAGQRLPREARAQAAAERPRADTEPARD